MTWPEVLDRLEADALRLAEAASAGAPEDVEVATAATIDVDVLRLPPLPSELANRAMAVLRVLSDAGATVAQRVDEVRSELAAPAANAESPTPRFIDQDL